MTLIEQIRADREAGTPGPWVFDKENVGKCFDWAWQLRTDWGGTPVYVVCDKGEPDARRIARVPEMEELILSQAAEIERLREALSLSIHYIEAAIEDGCPRCGGDCAMANPKPVFCPMEEARNDLLFSRAALEGTE